MKKIIFGLILTAVHSICSASIVTYNFTGAIGDTLFYFTPVATAFEPGNAITGHISIDTEAPANSGIPLPVNGGESGEWTEYAAVVAFSLTVGEFSFSLDNSIGNSMAFSFSCGWFDWNEKNRLNRAPGIMVTL